MNDITALMATMKAAAEKETPGRIGDRIDGSGSIKYECRGYDGSLVLRTDHKNMEYGFIGPNSKADELFFRECSPESVLALVEALEKAQAITAAAEKLVRCKGRYHSEQNYRALAALFGVNTPDLPPLDGESRSVTVKLPTGYVVRPGHPINEVERGVMIPKDGGAWLSRFDVEHMLKVAGIQVIEGEG